MSANTLNRSVPAALGLSFAVSLASVSLAHAADNPFAAGELQSELVAGASEGKCGEGKCGADKKDAGADSTAEKVEGKCGEGKCGADEKKDDDKTQSHGSDSIDKPERGSRG